MSEIMNNNEEQVVKLNGLFAFKEGMKKMDTMRFS